MNMYTERPKRGNARKAWDYLTKQDKKEPIELFYSRSHIDGPRWVGYFGSAVSYGTLQHSYGEVESSTLFMADFPH